MIVECIRENDYIVDKSSIIIIMNFQRPIYKVLRIKRRIYKSYKDYFQMFYPSLTDKSKSIAVIKVYK